MTTVAKWMELHKAIIDDWFGATAPTTPRGIRESARWVAMGIHADNRQRVTHTDPRSLDELKGLMTLPARENIAGDITQTHMDCGLSAAVSFAVCDVLIHHADNDKETNALIAETLGVYDDTLYLNATAVTDGEDHRIPPTLAASFAARIAELAASIGYPLASAEPTHLFIDSAEWLAVFRSAANKRQGAKPTIHAKPRNLFGPERSHATVHERAVNVSPLVGNVGAAIGTKRIETINGLQKVVRYLDSVIYKGDQIGLGYETRSPFFSDDDRPEDADLSIMARLLAEVCARGEIDDTARGVLSVIQPGTKRLRQADADRIYSSAVRLAGLSYFVNTKQERTMRELVHVPNKPASRGPDGRARGDLGARLTIRLPGALEQEKRWAVIDLDKANNLDVRSVLTLMAYYERCFAWNGMHRDGIFEPSRVPTQRYDDLAREMRRPQVADRNATRTLKKMLAEGEAHGLWRLEQRGTKEVRVMPTSEWTAANNDAASRRGNRGGRKK